jgi:hypothetical protein
MITVGDLGCPGVDVEKWRAENRAPLFPGKVNRWLLVRTTRDDPTPDDLKNTLAATFEKWFAGTPLDPAFPFDGTTRSAAADLVRLERVSKERLNLAHPARRFEELPGLLPSVRSGEVVWLEVTFAYRGQLLSMPWPVRTGAEVQLQSQAGCPVGADWMLAAAAFPETGAPDELSSADKAAAALGATAAKAGAAASGAAARAFDSLWTPLLLIAGGAVFFLVLKRALAEEPPHVSP